MKMKPESEPKVRLRVKLRVTIIGMAIVAAASAFHLPLYADVKTSSDVQAETQKNAGLAPEDYGSLYVIEQREEKVLPWRASLGYGFDLGNPYSQVHGISQTFERSLSRFFWLGVQATEYVSVQTQLMDTLKGELKADHITAVPQTPTYSLYGILTAVPLSGHLNFFGNNPLQTELAVRVGAGRIGYSGSDARFGIQWSVRPMVYFSKKISVQMGIGQEIESPFVSDDGITRLRGDVGVGFQF